MRRKHKNMGPFKRSINSIKPLLLQILDLIPNWILQRCINQYYSDKASYIYKTYDRLVALSRIRFFTRSWILIMVVRFPRQSSVLSNNKARLCASSCYTPKSSNIMTSWISILVSTLKCVPFAFAIYRSDIFSQISKEQLQSEKSGLLPR